MNLRCDFCGRFMSYKSVIEGSAYIHEVTPDSHYSKEKYECCCEKCKKSSCQEQQDQL